MDSHLTRAQHYRALAKQMREAAQGEFDKYRRDQLLDLERQYNELADKLVQAAQKTG